jgi:hypothetical protein
MFRESWSIVRMLVVAIPLAASWGCCSSQPGNHLILVPIPEESKEKYPVLSQKAKHQMVWRSFNGTTGVNVVVKLKDGQVKPFKNMNCDGKICPVPCVPSCAICFSGEINPDLVPPEKGEYYEYDASLVGAPAADPGFIIKP